MTRIELIDSLADLSGNESLNDEILVMDNNGDVYDIVDVVSNPILKTHVLAVVNRNDDDE
jgi:hypothetical protein